MVFLLALAQPVAGLYGHYRAAISEQPRIVHDQELGPSSLDHVLAASPAGEHLPLLEGMLREVGTVMGELYALARQRSTRGDAAAENRALLIALAEIANGVGLGWPGAGALHLGGLNLAGRGDYVQHFTLSAALAAIAGEELAGIGRTLAFTAHGALVYQQIAQGL